MTSKLSILCNHIMDFIKCNIVVLSFSWINIPFIYYKRYNFQYKATENTFNNEIFNKNI